MRIDQILPAFTGGDAISNYAVELRKLFRDWGYPSEIFVPAANFDAGIDQVCRPLSEHSRLSSAEDIIIYHFSIGDMTADYFRKTDGIKIIIYHNITPAHYFAIVKPEMAIALKQGRQKLLELASVTDLALGVSEYNRKELEEAGFRRTGVIPLTINWSGMDGEPNRELINKYRGKGEIILFVGRVVPNKKIEDLLKAFYHFKLIKPEARLVLLGNYRDTPDYYEFLQRIIRELDLRDVIFTGHTTHAELLAYYKLASVYLCLSEHEGFCLPLMEAMHFGIPVMAYGAAAVPDTMAGSGVMIKEKNYPAIAEMAALICDNSGFRRKITEGQYRRLNNFRENSVEDLIKEHLSPWLSNR
jgi:L-malate glycosyltransferase